MPLFIAQIRHFLFYRRNREPLGALLLPEEG